MPLYSEIENMILKNLPNAVDIIVERLPKDWTATSAIIISIIALLFPIFGHYYGRWQSAKQLRKIILVYISSFERKIGKIIQEQNWNYSVSFEEYNRKNYEVMESLLERIFVLHNEEIDAYINFVESFKISDEMCLDKDYKKIEDFKEDLIQLKKIIVKNIKET
jgi:hypothetical protein